MSIVTNVTSRYKTFMRKDDIFSPDVIINFYLYKYI